MAAVEHPSGGAVPQKFYSCSLHGLREESALHPRTTHRPCGHLEHILERT